MSCVVCVTGIFPTFEVHLSSICFWNEILIDYRFQKAISCDFHRKSCMGKHSIWLCVCVCVRASVANFDCNRQTKIMQLHQATHTHAPILWAILMICLHCACQRNQHIIECLMHAHTNKNRSSTTQSSKNYRSFSPYDTNFQRVYYMFVYMNGEIDKERERDRKIQSERERESEHLIRRAANVSAASHNYHHIIIIHSH